jgi:hypothetical protein
MESASAFLASSDWKPNGVDCEYFGNDGWIFTERCQQPKDCSLWYDQVLPTNGSSGCKLVDESSGSCCPELRKPSIFLSFIVAVNK